MPKLPIEMLTTVVQTSLQRVSGSSTIDVWTRLLDAGLSNAEQVDRLKVEILNTLPKGAGVPARITTLFVPKGSWTVARTAEELSRICELQLPGDPIEPGEE